MYTSDSVQRFALRVIKFENYGKMYRLYLLAEYLYCITTALLIKPHAYELLSRLLPYMLLVFNVNTGYWMRVLLQSLDQMDTKWKQQHYGRSVDPIITIISRRSAVVPYNNNNNNIICSMCAGDNQQFSTKRCSSALDVPGLPGYANIVCNAWPHLIHL